MLTDLEIAEALGAVAGELTGRRMKVRLIEGNRLGSTGYYPAEVLLRDGPKVFKKGTPMYLDHQTPEERELRPHGRVADYVGELAEDAYYENDGLYAEIEVFEDAAPLIKARKDKIGISIRARGVAEDTAIDGKMVPVFKQITEARSADFVVRAGAGGKIVSILESATADADEKPEVAIEESGENMELQDIVDGVTAAIKSEFGDRLTKIEESLKPAEVVEAVDALEIAEALAESKLNSAGRKRVLALFRAEGGELDKLIEAEEAYVEANKPGDDTTGIEESAGAETNIEESAAVSVNVPTIGAWSTK